MAILTFRVKGQTLTVESKINKIVENSVNYLDYEIIYDDEKWDSPLAKKVVVTYDKKTYEIFGDKIPSQVIHAPGFTVGVVGYKSGSVDDSGIIITTSPVAIKVFPSGAIEGTIPEDTAIDVSVAEQLNEKIEIQANEIKNNYLSVNTAIAELEKGTITTLDTVNVWELEAGAYYVNSIVFYATPHPPVYLNCVEMQSKKGLLYVHIDISNNTTRNFYLFANGNIYFGNSMPNAGTADGFGSISSVVADIRHEITSENVDGIPTKKAVYNYGENIKTDVNTALATLEQGIFKALPSGTVNLWELESGLYRVTANTTIKNSTTDTLWKPANPYSYLYVSGESYTGSTDQRYVVGWAYLASTIYENSYAAKVFTGATYTDGTAKENTAELATVTKLTALENRLDTKLETALSGKVNKSDVLSNIDKNAQPEDIYNAPVVNTALAEIEKGIFKEITSPCHIATLEKGVYVVKGGGDYTGKVTFANVKDDKTINDSYFTLNGGLLVVHENIKEIEADGTETSIISFIAQGNISVPNKSYSGDVQGSPIEIKTVKSATNIQCYMLESTKFAESTAPYEANKWYSTMPDSAFSDIPASAIKNEITTESTIYDIPSALAVKNFGENIKTELLANIGKKADKTEIETLKTELQGNINEISAVVNKEVIPTVNTVNSTFKTVKSINLINPELITTGYLGTNCVLKTNAGRITDFIKVEPNTTYTGANFGTSGTWSSWFFESDDLSTNISIIPSLTFTTPENCNYVRLVYAGDIAKTSMLVKGETYPPTYIDYTEDYFVLEDGVSSRAVEPFMKKYNNQFWDYNFGRCTVNTTTHRIEKATNGAMVGSGLFRIFPNVIYHTGLISLPQCYLYDKNMNFISTMETEDVVISGGNTKVFTITNPDVAYAIFTCSYSSYDANNAFIKVYNDSDKYVDVNDDLLNSIGNNINAPYTKGKKWACLGDSITFGYSLTNANESRYSTLVSKECGVVPYNYGYSGSRIAVYGETTASTYTQAMVIRYESMIDDADIITVFGGINDANNNLPLGEFGSTDIYTFYGALDTLINGLQSKYPGKAIGFITPLNYGQNAKHEKYVNAMLDICGKYAVPVLDMYHEGLISTRTDALSALYFADGLHPNELGHRVMARKIANFLNSL